MNTLPTVRYYRIATGDARDEGRQPSHNGEYLSIYYYGDEWIVEDNAGMVCSHLHDYEDMMNDTTSLAYFDNDECEKMMEEAAEIQEEIDTAIARGWGSDAAAPQGSTGPLGGEARKTAMQWGWPVTPDGGAYHPVAYEPEPAGKIIGVSDKRIHQMLDSLQLDEWFGIAAAVNERRTRYVDAESLTEELERRERE